MKTNQNRKNEEKGLRIEIGFDQDQRGWYVDVFQDGIQIGTDSYLDQSAALKDRDRIGGRFENQGWVIVDGVLGNLNTIYLRRKSELIAIRSRIRKQCLDALKEYIEEAENQDGLGYWMKDSEDEMVKDFAQYLMMILED